LRFCGLYAVGNASNLVLFCQFPQIVLAASCDKWLSIMARPLKVINADTGVFTANA
jgi:hypothetical protein